MIYILAATVIILAVWLLLHYAGREIERIDQEVHRAAHDETADSDDSGRPFVRRR